MPLVSNSMQILQASAGKHGGRAGRGLRPSSAKVGGTYGLAAMSSGGSKRRMMHEPSYSHASGQAQRPLMNNFTGSQISRQSVG